MLVKIVQLKNGAHKVTLMKQKKRQQRAKLQKKALKM